MKMSVASILFFAAIAGQLLGFSSTVYGAGLTLPGIISPILGPVSNLTAPILGPVSDLTAPLTNLTSPIISPIISPITNLTGGVLAPITNLTTTPSLAGLNLSTIIGSLNLTAGAPGLNLSTILGPVNAGAGLNLSSIIGPLNNLTGPLQSFLSNFTGPPTNLSVATNVTLTVTLNIPSSSNLFTAFPTSVTINPLGFTEVLFSLMALQGSNLSSVPVSLVVPVISYLNVPVTGSAGVNVDLPPGTSLSVIGITNPTTRLFFGVSWQTFPQLTNVLISKLIPGSSQSVPLYNLPVPALL